MVRLGLSFENSGLDLDRRIWRFIHLWCVGILFPPSDV